MDFERFKHLFDESFGKVSPLEFIREMEALGYKFELARTPKEEKALDEAFEKIWVEEYVNMKNDADKELGDDEYIEYKKWSQKNCKRNYEKHIPGTFLIQGNPPNTIFHGGCLGCISQRNYGIERCKGCRYFRWNMDKPYLRIP